MVEQAFSRAAVTGRVTLLPQRAHGSATEAHTPAARLVPDDHLDCLGSGYAGTLSQPALVVRFATKLLRARPTTQKRTRADRGQPGRGVCLRLQLTQVGRSRLDRCVREPVNLAALRIDLERCEKGRRIPTAYLATLILAASGQHPARVAAI